MKSGNLPQPSGPRTNELVARLQIPEPERIRQAFISVVSPRGDNGANPWTDTCMVTVWLRLVPPLDRGTTWIELSTAGRSAQVRATLPLSSQ